MSEQAPEEQEQDGVTTIKAADLRNLRAKADKTSDLEKTVAELTRKEAFREAGIDPSDKKAGYFVKGYDGELSADAIRAAATEAGFIEPPAPTPEQQQQLDTADAINSAASGAEPLLNASEDKVVAEMTKAMSEGGTEAMLMVARKYGAVVSDDLM